jgi:vitamin B12 transporter
MNVLLISLAAAAAAPPAPASELPGDTEIVVTGEAEEEETSSAVSVTAPLRIRSVPPLTEHVGLPMVTDYLRLFSSVSVATAGPRGSQTQVRLRGAEANHTLLVVDGIRFNDPAAGNEPRFELLSMDFIDHATLYLGSRSALWGSEAIGGVLVVDTRDPWFSREGVGLRGEYGSLDTARGSAWAGAIRGKTRLAGTASWLRSDGIDSFSGSGDRDGFENRTAGLKLVFVPGKRDARETPFELGAVGHWIEGVSEYDGFDPLTFRRADTLDSTRNRIAAVRGWAKAEKAGWTLAIDGSLLASANRNRLADTPLNATFGRRFTTSAELSKKAGGHHLSVGVDHQAERFRARDTAFFGATNQGRSRELTALVGEWQAEWSRRLSTEVAVRRDRFSAFADATTIRAGATLKPVRRLEILAGYGEGIAQPSFHDLYGFFPGSFVGNPALKPERSEGWNAGVRFGRWHGLTLELGYFAAKLEDEIVDVFDPGTFLSSAANATGKSRRQGVEARLELARYWRALPRLFVTYSYLDAEERQVAGGLAVREVRRPRHRAGLGAQGEVGRLGWGATLAYVGPRRDMNFDVAPAQSVRLGAYWLGSLQVRLRISKEIEGFARVENALDERYQDVFGYRAQGRTIHAGLRLRLDP